jgi:hypothetical protein
MFIFSGTFSEVGRYSDMFASSTVIVADEYEVMIFLGAFLWSISNLQHRFCRCHKPCPSSQMVVSSLLSTLKTLQTSLPTNTSGIIAEVPSSSLISTV